MRIHAIALGILLAAGCTAPDGADDAAAVPPAADTPAPAPAGVEPEADPDAATVDTVPDQFQGDYAADGAACSSTGHVTALTIATSRIEFHESSGDITGVEARGNDIDITAELTGEGETREATYSFRLSEDGQTLTDTVNGLARQRCG